MGLTRLAQQSRQRASAFALHQPQQYGHEVLVLRLTELLSGALGKVAQLVIQAYNGNRHRTPAWSQGVFFTCLIPQGVLSCHPPFQKVQT